MRVVSAVDGHRHRRSQCVFMNSPATFAICMRTRIRLRSNSACRKTLQRFSYSNRPHPSVLVRVTGFFLHFGRFDVNLAVDYNHNPARRQNFGKNRREYLQIFTATLVDPNIYFIKTICYAMAQKSHAHHCGGGVADGRADRAASYARRRQPEQWAHKLNGLSNMGS